MAEQPLFGATAAGAAPGQRDWIAGQIGAHLHAVESGVHQHPEGELIWVDAGVQTVRAGTGVWVLPSGLALWVPGGVVHRASKIGSGFFHWIGASPALSQRLQAACCAVRMTAPLKQAVAVVMRRGQVDATGSEGAGIVASFCACLHDCGLRAVALPTTEPPLLQPILRQLWEQPADDRPASEWAELLRVSPSTMSRAFRRELGMPLRDFRRQVRFVSALEQLASGQEVSSVAHGLGYRSVSMFVEAFRKHLGETPGRYFAAAPTDGEPQGDPGGILRT